MAYQHKDNSGSLFKNTKREKDTHPNATGSCMIDGIEYWVSAWTKTGEGGPWQSLAFKRKEEQQEKPKSESKPADFDDDIPF